MLLFDDVALLNDDSTLTHQNKFDMTDIATRNKQSRYPQRAEIASCNITPSQNHFYSENYVAI
jgi:hypothetical protein